MRLSADAISCALQHFSVCATMDAMPSERPSPMLFTPYRLGALTLPNRLVMPPMTCSRAAAGDVPTALMAQYYAQRPRPG
jgi:2,4-dienoyl-CoA reductase-like NADH-dependent reductase (Old Yellow Enzyme family)